MRLYQRLCHVVAQDGLSGLCRRSLRKLLDPLASQRIAEGLEKALQESRQQEEAELQARRQAMVQAKEDYARQVKNFAERTRQGMDPHCHKYCWYHTVDLGNGLITPGDYDFRPILSQFQFPSDMTGMDVLDVGSATGYFAFEFEKRGARVVAVDLPSLAAWDLVHVEKEETLRSFIDWHETRTLDEASYCHLEGPFQFCRKALNSKVKRCHSTIYDLCPAQLGVKAFDLIFAGDVLCHIFSPLQALDRLASVCRGTLVLSQEVIGGDETQPLLHYVGGATRECTRGWWRPNQACMMDMMRKVGFKNVTMIGSHRGIVRREWIEYERTVFHASK